MSLYGLHAHAARAHRLEAERAAQQVRASRAEKPRDAHDLAAMQLQRDRSRAGRLQLEDRLTALPSRSRVDLAHRRARHHGHDLAWGRLGRAAAAGVPTVPQHDEAVGDLLHLLQEMRDVDDGVALPSQTADQLEETPRVVLGQAARGLVEDEHTATDRHRARDLHELLPRDRQRGHRRVGRDLAVAELRQRLPRPLPGLAPIHQSQPRGLQAEDHVLRHREVWRQRELLVDHLHAGPTCFQRAARPVRGAVQLHLPRVGRQRPGEDSHQRALARAVLADERAYLARRHLQVHPVERDRGPEGFPDAAHPEAGG